MVNHSDKPAISSEESRLFRNSMAPVQPKKPANRHAPARALPSARPKPRDADTADAVEHSLDDGPDDFATGTELSFRQDGVQLRVMRKLRRGKYRCQAELDLHGMLVPAARHAIVEFLVDARAKQLRCVRIIHGKGLRSGDHGPVLKNRVAHWLRQREEVLAYCSARPVDGGTGAVYVLLGRS